MRGFKVERSDSYRWAEDITAWSVFDSMLRSAYLMASRTSPTGN
ncbi:hypothetical protein [Ilumatobacter sp.]|nr:hypothetical protein [Ilumatobacter sp.]